MSTRQVSNRNDPLIEDVCQLAEPLAGGEKPAERWRVVKRRRNVGKASRECLPARLIQPVAGELLDTRTGALAELGIHKVASARADDRVTLRQKALEGQVI